jgi:hypothetical protein
MPQLNLPQVTRPTSLERVRFRDGMIVHADDLDRAIRYPLDLFRLLIRAYFGCGVVCGLEVEPRGSAGDPFSVVVKPGVAVDCAGYPIELCREAVIDVLPGPSSCQKPECVCIMIRRLPIEESPRRPCGCGDQAAPDDPCSGVRVQEQVQIKVFPCNAPPACVCRHERPQEEAEGYWEKQRERICACLRACGRCSCGGDACSDDGWVLLACLNFTLGADGQPTAVATIDTSYRRYVKPIDCLCRRDQPEPPSDRACPPADGDTRQRPGYSPGRASAAAGRMRSSMRLWARGRSG